MILKDFIQGKIPIGTKCKKIEQGVCGICNDYGKCYSDSWSTNFTNQDEVGSLLVCTNCLPLLNSDYRKRSFYITSKEAKTLKQKDILPIIRSIEFPCILSFTESNKKHRLFRSIVSYNKNEVYLNLDTSYVILDLEEDLSIIETLEEFYNSHKVSKARMLNGSFPINAIKKIGIEAYMEFEEMIILYRGSRKLGYFINFINKYDR